MKPEVADKILPVGSYYVCHEGEGFDVDGADSTVRQVTERGSILSIIFPKLKQRGSRIVAIFRTLRHWPYHTGDPHTRSTMPQIQAELVAEALNKFEFIPDKFGENLVVRNKTEFDYSFEVWKCPTCWQKMEIKGYRDFMPVYFHCPNCSIYKTREELTKG